MASSPLTNHQPLHHNHHNHHNQGTGLFAPYHQHIFCARFDMALDGVHNRIKEVDSHPCPKGT